MDKQVIDFVECRIFPVLDALSELLQSGNIDAGKITALYDTMVAGIKADFREEVAG